MRNSRISDLRNNGTVNRTDYVYDASGKVSSITQSGHNLSYACDDNGTYAGQTYAWQAGRQLALEN